MLLSYAKSTINAHYKFMYGSVPTYDTTVLSADSKNLTMKENTKIERKKTFPSQIEIYIRKFENRVSFGQNTHKK